jgi:hypothetical protein
MTSCVKFFTVPKSDLDEEEREEMRNLSRMMMGFQDFVGMESQFDGALFPGQEQPADDEEEVSEGTVAFDPSSFLQTMMSSFGKSSHVKFSRIYLSSIYIFSQ